MASYVGVSTVFIKNAS